MLTPACKNALKGHINLFLGVFVFGILLSCAKTPQQTIENPSEFYKHRNSIVRVESRLGFSSKGKGSGFFVQRNKVATNIHVIARPGPVYVKSADKKTTWKVEGVAAYDVKNDLVILKVVGEGEALPLGNSDVVRDKEPIFVVGFPGGKYKVAEGTLHSIRNSDKWLRMSVNTAGGGSGGPVLNSKGQVIGVQALGVDFISHAIPSNTVKVLLTQSESTEPLEQWHKRELIRSYAHYVKGEMYYYDKKRYDKAIANLDESIRLNPDSIYAYSKRGDVKFNLGNHKDAIEDYNKAIKLNPQHATAYGNRGAAKSKLGDHKDAIEDFNKVIKLNPQDAKAYNNRGAARQQLGDYKSAIEDHDKAIKLNSQNATTYYNRGVAKQKLGDYKGAISDYDKAIKLNPQDAAPYHNRGEAKRKLGDYEGAISDYDKAINLNPKIAVAYRNRARAREALGQHDAAKADFEKAKELDPDIAK